MDLRLHLTMNRETMLEEGDVLGHPLAAHLMTSDFVVAVGVPQRYLHYEIRGTSSPLICSAHRSHPVRVCANTTLCTLITIRSGRGETHTWLARTFHDGVWEGTWKEPL